MTVILFNPCVHQNDEEFLETFGYLYNLYAVGTGRLCPDGRSVPSVPTSLKCIRDQ